MAMIPQQCKPHPRFRDGQDQICMHREQNKMNYQRQNILTFLYPLPNKKQNSLCVGKISITYVAKIRNKNLIVLGLNEKCVST